MNGYYPPSGTEGELIDNLNQLPINYKLVDFNEFYRLFKHKENYYIYKVKNPKTALHKIISNINEIKEEL